jgi:nondiscriminating glutamyl-tRNA synthetase
MTKFSSVRVRFAPSPTGMMHLGNVRTALMNYLFAKRHHGTFIIRIEDTDQARNFDPHATQILDDLLWLGLDYDEGPIKGGPYQPYFQSQRTSIYEEKLTILRESGLAYRCFCTHEELEKKRKRQLLLKLPPRYDRTCLSLSPQVLEQKLAEKKPFIWRFKFDTEKMIALEDLGKGTVTFELKNFSDFSLTRPDGSFTFMFANCIDDIVMRISHIIRGEDHLTNTVGQVALFQAFQAQIPTFWHLPIMGNKEGKKLSKRDFGFSLHDLKKAGFLPEAIDNYLAIIGGGTFEQEIMALPELAAQLDFNSIKSTGQVRYDVEKLKWINHKWTERLKSTELAQRCLPLLQDSYPAAQHLSLQQLVPLIEIIKTDLIVLTDCISLLRFYFERPTITQEQLSPYAAHFKQIVGLMQDHRALIDENVTNFINTIKSACKQKQIQLKDMFSLIRIALTGKADGLAIHDVMAALGATESKARLQQLANIQL